MADRMQVMRELNKLKNSVDQAIKQDITELKESGEVRFHDYKKQKIDFLHNSINTSKKELARLTSQFLIGKNIDSKINIEILKSIENIGNENNVGNIKNFVVELENNITQIKDNTLQQTKQLEISFPRMSFPEEVNADMQADLAELKRCYQAECYRSSTIICGRVLETALHRKYFEATNFDILEKNPGIGLGNLIAKLREKNVSMDPALTQQIHLINQVRVFSVHKKQEAFLPSKEQAQAVILYTIDALKKMF
ncbi:hypothetical protein ACFL0W_04550 [Nanoarchaeota archaeon]